MTLKASLVIGGDAAGAKSALAATDAALAKSEAASKALARAQREAATAINEAKAAALAEKITLEELKAVVDASRASVSKFQADLDTANKQLGNSTAGLADAKAGYGQLGQEIVGVARSAAGGANIGELISGQGLEVVTSVAGMSSKFAGLEALLTGPWGAAIGFTVSILGDLVSTMWETEDVTDKGAAAIDRLSNKLDLSKNSYASLIAVVNEYNKKQDDSIALTYAAILAAEKEARANLKLAEAKLVANAATTGNPDAEYIQTSVDRHLRDQITALKGELNGASMAASDERVKRATDERYRLETDWLVKLHALREREKADVRNLLDYEKERLSLTRQMNASLDAYDESQRRTASPTAGNQASAGDMSALLKQLFGAGTYIGDNAKHKKYTSSGSVSDHWGANPRALDFVPQGGMARYSTAEVERMLKEAGVEFRRGSAGNEQFFGPGRPASKPGDHDNHFHVAWKGSPSPESADRAAEARLRAAERQAEAQRREAEQLETIGQRVANITGQFSDLPPVVARASQSMRQLDDIASDIEGRKGPKYDAIRADLADAKRAVEESLVQPFNDYIAAQQESAEIDQLLIAGRDAEAEALQRVLQLQEAQGPLSQSQLDAVLATVVAERERGMVLRDQRALIEANVGAVHDMRSALEGTFADALKLKFSPERVLASIGNSWIDQQSRQIVESLFGAGLRELELQASGQDKVRAANEAMAASTSDAGKAVESFGDVVQRVTQQIATPQRDVAGLAVSGVDDALATAFDSVFRPALDQLAAGANSSDPSVGEEIVVTAKLDSITGGDDSRNLIIDMVDKVTRGFGIKLPDKLLESAKTFLNNLEANLPNVLKGALIGQTASSLILGKGGSKTGASLGGAVGEAAFKAIAPKLFSSLGSFAGPIGSIAGGLLGGLIGGLLTKAKTGSASVTNSAIGLGGNNAEAKSGANSIATTIQGKLGQIAERLGGSVGSYGFSLGTRKDEYRVSGSAGSDVTSKNPKGLIYRGKDADEAARAAFLNAIADGAIEGISDRVQRALRSSSDIDKAITEALKVQELEVVLGGIGGQITKALRDFERQAKDRLRIASQYGFDVVAVEQRNAEDRLKLTEKLLASQVGSLQSLIEEMTSGSLFEGSGADQREALLIKIAKAKADADAGVEGAGDVLARLFEQLNTVSKEYFATTGGFAGDRALILDQARDSIARANQRIADAQSASDPALATTNAALDENNSQNAQMLAALGISNDYLRNILARSGSSSLNDLYALANTQSQG